MLKVKWLKKLYNTPKDKAWLYLKRAGHRAELYHYYMPKMEYLRHLYEEKDYALLRICLKELKNKSLYYANRDMGFAVNEELFTMLIELLTFQGRQGYVDQLLQETTEELLKPIEERNLYDLESK